MQRRSQYSRKGVSGPEVEEVGNPARGDKVHDYQTGAGFLQLKKPVNSARKCMPKWIDPFTVTQLVRPVALKLELPAPWRIHPVFHVSLTKPYLSDGTVQPLQPLSYLKGEPRFSADYILKKKVVREGHKSETQYLIRWTDCGPANDTWEPSSNISNKDPKPFVVLEHVLNRAQPF